MKTPDSPKFLLWSFIQAAALQEGQTLQTELSSLLTLADSQHPNVIRRQQKLALKTANRAPGKKTIAAVKAAFSEGDTHSAHIRHQYRKMKDAARAAGWTFYVNQVKPFLRELYDQALKVVREEKEKQAEFEKLWPDQMTEIQAWMLHYGGHAEVPSALPKLEEMEAAILRERAIYLQAEPAYHEDPPKIPGTFLPTQQQATGGENPDPRSGSIGTLSGVWS